MAEPYIEYSTVRVIKPITDCSPGATAGTIVDAVPLGADGTIVEINNMSNLPLSYWVEFSEPVDEEHWLLTILHDELEVTWSPGPAPTGGSFRLTDWLLGAVRRKR